MQNPPRARGLGMLMLVAGLLTACGAASSASVPSVAAVPNASVAAPSTLQLDPPSPSPSASATIKPATPRPQAQSPTVISATARPQAESPTAKPTPPKPTGVEFSIAGYDPTNQGNDSELTPEVSWKTPRADGFTIKVYGVNECVIQQESSPCLVPGTPLPKDSLDLIAEAPASAGFVDWTWPNWGFLEDGLMAHDGTTYYSVVVAAYDASGHSTFAIAATSDYCRDCGY